MIKSSKRITSFALLILLALSTIQLSNAYVKKATIIYFWAEGCPQCEKLKEFLVELKAKYPYVEVEGYEIKNNPNNLEMLKRLSKKYGFEPRMVPIIFIDGIYRGLF